MSENISISLKTNVDSKSLEKLVGTLDKLGKSFRGFVADINATRKGADKAALRIESVAAALNSFTSAVGKATESSKKYAKQTEHTASAVQKKTTAQDADTQSMKELKAATDGVVQSGQKMLSYQNSVPGALQKQITYTKAATVSLKSLIQEQRKMNAESAMASSEKFSRKAGLWNLKDVSKMKEEIGIYKDLFAEQLADVRPKKTGGARRLIGLDSFIGKKQSDIEAAFASGQRVSRDSIGPGGEALRRTLNGRRIENEEQYQKRRSAVLDKWNERNFKRELKQLKKTNQKKASINQKYREDLARRQAQYENRFGLGGQLPSAVLSQRQSVANTRSATANRRLGRGSMFFSGVNALGFDAVKVAKGIKGVKASVADLTSEFGQGLKSVIKYGGAFQALALATDTIAGRISSFEEIQRAGAIAGISPEQVEVLARSATIVAKEFGASRSETAELTRELVQAGIGLDLLKKDAKSFEGILTSAQRLVSASFGQLSAKDAASAFSALLEASKIKDQGLGLTEDQAISVTEKRLQTLIAIANRSKLGVQEFVKEFPQVISLAAKGIDPRDIDKITGNIGKLGAVFANTAASVGTTAAEIKTTIRTSLTRLTTSETLGELRSFFANIDFSKLNIDPATMRKLKTSIYEGPIDALLSLSKVYEQINTDEQSSLAFIVGRIRQNLKFGESLNNVSKSLKLYNELIKDNNVASNLADENSRKWSSILNTLAEGLGDLLVIDKINNLLKGMALELANVARAANKLEKEGGTNPLTSIGQKTFGLAFLGGIANKAARKFGALLGKGRGAKMMGTFSRMLGKSLVKSMAFPGGLGLILSAPDIAALYKAYNASAEKKVKTEEDKKLDKKKKKLKADLEKNSKELLKFRGGTVDTRNMIAPNSMEGRMSTIETALKRTTTTVGTVREKFKGFLLDLDKSTSFEDQADSIDNFAFAARNRIREIMIAEEQLGKKDFVGAEKRIIQEQQKITNMAKKARKQLLAEADRFYNKQQRDANKLAQMQADERLAQIDHAAKMKGEHADSIEKQKLIISAEKERRKRLEADRKLQMDSIDPTLKGSTRKLAEASINKDIDDRLRQSELKQKKANERLMRLRLKDEDTILEEVEKNAKKKQKAWEKSVKGALKGAILDMPNEVDRFLKQFEAKGKKDKKEAENQAKRFAVKTKTFDVNAAKAKQKILREELNLVELLGDEKLKNEKKVQLFALEGALKEFEIKAKLEEKLTKIKTGKFSGPQREKLTQQARQEAEDLLTAANMSRAFKIGKVLNSEAIRSRNQSIADTMARDAVSGFGPGNTGFGGNLLAAGIGGMERFARRFNRSLAEVVTEGARELTTSERVLASIGESMGEAMRLAISSGKMSSAFDFLGKSVSQNAFSMLGEILTTGKLGKSKVGGFLGDLGGISSVLFSNPFSIADNTKALTGKSFLGDRIASGTAGVLSYAGAAFSAYSIGKGLFGSETGMSRQQQRQSIADKQALEKATEAEGKRLAERLNKSGFKGLEFLERILVQDIASVGGKRDANFAQRLFGGGKRGISNLREFEKGVDNVQKANATVSSVLDLQDAIDGLRDASSLAANEFDARIEKEKNAGAIAIYEKLQKDVIEFAKSTDLVGVPFQQALEQMVGPEMAMAQDLQERQSKAMQQLNAQREQEINRMNDSINTLRNMSNIERDRAARSSFVALRGAGVTRDQALNNAEFTRRGLQLEQSVLNAMGRDLDLLRGRAGAEQDPFMKAILEQQLYQAEQNFDVQKRQLDVMEAGAGASAVQEIAQRFAEELAAAISSVSVTLSAASNALAKYDIQRGIAESLEGAGLEDDVFRSGFVNMFNDNRYMDATKYLGAEISARENLIQQLEMQLSNAILASDKQQLEDRINQERLAVLQQRGRIEQEQLALVQRQFAQAQLEADVIASRVDVNQQKLALAKARGDNTQIANSEYAIQSGLTSQIRELEKQFKFFDQPGGALSDQQTIERNRLESQILQLQLQKLNFEKDAGLFVDPVNGTTESNKQLFEVGSTATTNLTQNFTVNAGAILGNESEARRFLEFIRDGLDNLANGVV